MSRSEALVCDGCGEMTRVTRLTGGAKYLAPVGWLRLPVWAGLSGEDMKRLGEVEICSPECAPFALKQYFEICRDPVKHRSPPSDAPGSGSSSEETDAL